MPCSRTNTDRNFQFACWRWVARCALFSLLLGCSGCAWFKTAEPVEANFREDPKEARVRPKREEGKHYYGGLSPEANAIERNLGY